MALQAKVIKAKISSVKNIRKITRAMEMVAATKMRKATQKAQDSKPYVELARELLNNVQDNKGISHPLLEEPKEALKTLIVGISSNKGLCGGYNSNIRKKVAEYVKENEGDYSFVAIGKYMERQFGKMSGNMVASFNQLGDTVSEEDLWSINSLIIEEFKKGEYKEVILFYTRFNSPISYTPIQKHMLPIRKEDIDELADEMGIKDSGEDSDGPAIHFPSFVYEPGEGEILEFLLPRITEVFVYQGMLESLASEHSSRMVAMKNATENAKNLIDDLTVGYNRARQAAITQEIAEISSGAVR